MHLLTAAESQAVDRATIDAGHATGEALMERAGAGIAGAIEDRFGCPIALHVLVLCGPGNNGGDGFVVARHLHARGANVWVGLLAERDRIRGDALRHLEHLEAAGVRVATCLDSTTLINLVTARAWDHAIDALLGTGATGAPRGITAAACEAFGLLRSRHTRITAVDLPTGIDADTGQAWPSAVCADLTVTFGAAKRGHFLYPGRAFRGDLEIIDIGLVRDAAAEVSSPVVLEPEGLSALLVPRDPRSHKGTSGRVMIAGGAAGMTGAIVLAATAAARCGAGYVRVCAPASVQDVLAAHLVEPMVVACGEDFRRALTTSALPQLLEEAERADAVALGPGWSRRHLASELVRMALPRIPCPVVLDADALYALSPARDHLGNALSGSPTARILTPHVLEMERLTGVDRVDIEARRIDIATEHARRWGVIVVLKGAPTVIAAPDGRVAVNPTGNPGMATAGMGDVLTGAIVALLAQGLEAFEASSLAVFTHGLAGDLAQSELGETGLIARDVVERLPRALQRVRDSATERRA